MHRTSPLAGSLALAGCLALAACGRPAAAPPQVSAAPADTAALERTIPNILRVSGVPGLAMAVVDHGRVVWTGAFGNVKDPQTIFEAASLSKPVFAYLVLRLVDRGEFDLDRPLAQMLEYPRAVGDPRYRRITGRMVLSHGTGFPNWGGERLTLAFDPGTAYGYSGEGFVYLQKVIEHVTGRSLEQLARTEVFAPLGMSQSSYVWQDRFEGHAAESMDWLWRMAPVTRYTEASAAYTLLTTAPDYGRFVGAVLTGNGLKPATWKAYLTPVRESSPGLGVGLGIRVEDGPRGRLFYHSGNNGRRFTCYMTGDLAMNRGLVYFTGAPNGTSLVEALAAPVFGGTHLSRHWEEYDRYDDPRLMALRAVRRAAIEGGPDSARARLRAIRENPATRPSLDDVLELGAFLAGRHLAPLSIELLRQAVAEAPDSARVHLALGGALEDAGQLPAAIATYRRALLLGGDSADTRARIRWAEERLVARTKPVRLPAAALERYAGSYQERTITRRGDELYYTDGAGRTSRLTPLSATLFELDEDPASRLRFEAEGSEPAGKVVGLYRDGSADESARTAPA
jgi:CubicO group peptidase (beta-lactamase class C family)